MMLSVEYKVAQRHVFCRKTRLLRKGRRREPRSRVLSYVHQIVLETADGVCATTSRLEPACVLS